MKPLIELLGQQFGGSSTKALSQQLGVDENQTRSAIAAAIPSLMEALTRNAATPEGAQRLHKAIEKKHNGSILDQLDTYIGQDENDDESAANKRMLEHILGPKQKPVESNIGKMSGMDASSVEKLMATLGPVVLGAIGRQQKQEKLDSDGLSKYLGQQRKEFQKADPRQASIFEKMLDQDGDGGFDMGDMAGLIGRMFKS